jgi:hypothetical protein
MNGCISVGSDEPDTARRSHVTPTNDIGLTETEICEANGASGVRPEQKVGGFDVSVQITVGMEKVSVQAAL